MLPNRYSFIRAGRLLPLLCAIVLTVAGCSASTLAPFTSDGCSAFPDGTLQNSRLWLQCCEAHDLAYWKGGTYQQRREADLELRQCVAQVGQKEIAQLMLAGVRVGGTPFLPTTFRWGYGWPYPRGYRPPTAEEQQQIDQRLLDRDSAPDSTPETK